MAGRAAREGRRGRMVYVPGGRRIVPRPGAPRAPQVQNEVLWPTNGQACRLHYPAGLRRKPPWPQRISAHIRLAGSSAPRRQGCAAGAQHGPAPAAGRFLPFTEHAALLGPCCDRRRRPPRVRASAVSARGSWRSRSRRRRTNAEIAEALHLSEATVKNHLKRIFDKLGLDGGARGKRMLLADVLPEKISP